MSRFVERMARMPRLGVGLSTEYGAGESGVDPVAYREGGGAVDFLELGVDLARGLDDDAKAWVGRGWPTTWHFLDVNLEEPDDVDSDWLAATRAGAREANAAWICGDAGMWHVGPRERGHGTLLAPIGCWRSVHALAESVVRIREATGLEVLPENPPAHVLLGDLHPLETFGAVAEAADCGLLLDLAHLVIVQRALGLPPDTLLDTFPLERVVELHVAGGSAFRVGARELVDDDHGPAVQDATWALLDRVIPRCTALRAVVVECERNPPDEIGALFGRVRAAVAAAPGWTAAPVAPPPVAVRPPDDTDVRGLQRTLFRMSLDPAFASAVRERGSGLGPREDRWLRAVDPDLVAADPGDRRRTQLLGNVTLEFLRTVRAAPSFHEAFLGAPELHDALAHDRPLALAFAAFADRALPEGPWRAVLQLDAAMAATRRASRTPPAGPGVHLTPGARVLTVPEGTLGLAVALQEDRDDGPSVGPGDEDVLLVPRPQGPHEEVQVHVEAVPPAIADLLRSLPLDDAGLAAFAARHDASRDDVAELVSSLRSDGVLAG